VKVETFARSLPGAALTGFPAAASLRGLFRSLHALLPQTGLSAAATENLAWLIAEKLARLVSGVFVGFWVARYLGPAQFGALSYGLALAGIGLALSEAGVEGVVKREIVRAPERTAEVLRAAARLRLTIAVVGYLCLLLWAAWGESAASMRALIAVLGLILFQPAFAVADLWLQAHLHARLAVRAQLLALGVGAAMRVALILARAPLLAFAVASVLEAALAAALLAWFARRAGRPWQAATDVSTAAGRLWRDAWPLLLSAVTVVIYLRIDVVMLRRMAGEPEAGVYAAAVRLSELASFLPGAVAASLLPSLLAARNESAGAYATAFQRFFDLNAGLAYALATPMVLLAPVIVRLAYGRDFSAAAAVLAVHGGTLMWAALGVARGQYCVNEGFTRMHLAATTAGALLNVALNWALIPRYGAVGAAWATFVAQAFAAWGSSFLYRPVRVCGFMQSRALLVPVRVLRNLWRRADPVRPF
jgi:O-antigen/teichoic acid export membrane protein